MYAYLVPEVGFDVLRTPRHPADRRHAEHGLKDSGMAKNENKAIHRPVKTKFASFQKAQAYGRWSAVGACSSAA